MGAPRGQDTAPGALFLFYSQCVKEDYYQERGHVLYFASISRMKMPNKPGSPTPYCGLRYRSGRMARAAVNVGLQ